MFVNHTLDYVIMNTRKSLSQCDYYDWHVCKHACNVCFWRIAGHIACSLARVIDTANSALTTSEVNDVKK